MFFFFQAEDGIRGLYVTGVQTCALPIYITRLFAATEHWYGFDERDVWTLFHSYAFDFSVWEIWGALLYGGRLVVVPYLRSEERRVGKECRSGWSRYC